ncbi:MAG: MarR family winged helix-turn-helix transcriptional regulator [Lachnospiraceae bacterium]|nr:MarR family winged helix-turn-helix transcriptional regulator [Ruminococcus sp.]MCM1275365.1 MarR family winged helix-turn-helix transcriptional regulator [Lachnospiraceae bacterium]
MDKRGIGVRLRLLNNAVRRYVDRYAEGKKALESLTCSNGWIIGYVCEMRECGRDVYQRDLENNFGITRSTASKVLGLMEKKGLIERVSVSHDARLKKIVPTEKSLEIGRIIKEDNEKMELLLKKGFSPKELEQLYGYLERIQSNLESAEKVGRRERI